MIARGRSLLAALAVASMAAAIAGCGSDSSDGPATQPPAGRDPLLPYPKTGQTKEIALTITEGVAWEVGPAAIYDAIAYNGQIPGPPIEVNAGDHVRIQLTNKAKKPHSIHTHVVQFTTDNDGVDAPSLVPPGETRTIEWDAVYAGTFPYHDHGDEAGIARGLFGALIVHAPDELPAKEQVVLLADFLTEDFLSLPGVADPKTGMFPDGGTYHGGHQYMHTINGKGYEDAIPPFSAKVGDRVRWRVVSIGTEVHTWHVHGHRWLDPSRSVLTDNVQLAPGTYTTFEWVEDNPGSWLVHCHVPNHMEGGMMARYVVSP